MSYRVTATSVKPAGVQWFSDANPASIEAYSAWVATLPGVISVTKTTPNANTIVRTYVFENQAAYTAYASAHASNTNDQQRQAYNNSNGITTTFQFLDA
jgi:hypothetical protein